MSGTISITSTAPGLHLSENTTVSGSQYLFIPDVLAANVTHFPVNLDILVTNLGSFAHTFTLVPQPNVTLTVGNYSTYLSNHTPLASVSVPAKRVLLRFDLQSAASATCPRLPAQAA